jgi:hypothetical protein
MEVTVKECGFGLGIQTLFRIGMFDIARSSAVAALLSSIFFIRFEKLLSAVFYVSINLLNPVANHSLYCYFFFVYFLVLSFFVCFNLSDLLEVRSGGNQLPSRVMSSAFPQPSRPQGV